MNTKTKQNQTHQRRQKQGPKKQTRNPNMLTVERKPHEQEYPETRLTR